MEPHEYLAPHHHEAMHISAKPAFSRRDEDGFQHEQRRHHHISKLFHVDSAEYKTTHDKKHKKKGAK